MPSLPPDNQAVGSDFDLYRRYFGRFKRFSPHNPRRVLVLFGIIVTISSFVLLGTFIGTNYVFFNDLLIYNKDKLYYLEIFNHGLYYSLFCYTVLAIIFGFDRQRKCVLILSLLIVNVVLLGISMIFGYLTHELNKKYGPNKCDINNDIKISCAHWQYDTIFTKVIYFPLSIWLSLVVMYVMYFHCCKRKYADVDSNEFDEDNRFIELQDHDVSSFTYKASIAYDDEGDGGDSDKDPELSVQSDQIVQMTLDNLSIEKTQTSTKTIIFKHMLIYIVMLIFMELIWYFIASMSIGGEQFEYLIMLISLNLLYIISKYFMKRRARKMDIQNTSPQFSFEILTEIFVSSFYWINMRMYLVYVTFDSSLYFGIFIGQHMLIQIFLNTIRTYNLYFTATPKLECFKVQEKKSNFVQWRVRCAIDTTIKYIIIIYSMIYVIIRYATKTYDVLYPINANTNNNDNSYTILNQSISNNFILFGIEFIYFTIIIFIDICGGNISPSNHLNYAEPLMRIYKSNKKVFTIAFVSSLTLISVLDYNNVFSL